MEPDANGVIDLPVDAVVYREDLYPRSLTDHLAVQTYAENLDVMPPIEVNQHHILIDGWHRWMAHKKEERPTIRARVTETQSDVHLLDLAVERNSRHGLQLSRAEKQEHARKRYNMTPLKERDAAKKALAHLLSVTERTLNNWIRRIDEDTEKESKARAFSLWLACHTLEEIAEHCSVSSVGTIHKWMEKFFKNGNLSKHEKSLSDHATDFDVPQKNIWNGHDKTPHLNFPGSTEPRWLDNLLYFYTQPFDIVVDPFAGSGSSIEVCKKRFRRYWVSDRKPIPERAHEIRPWDVTNGLPPLHNWRDVKLVYLDPPYWKQVEGEYSQDPTDLANMDLDTFHATLGDLIRGFGKKLASGSSIALIIQPTHWKAPDHQYTDHLLTLVARVGLPVTMRIACPLDTPRYTEYLRWALDSRTMLALNREIVVWTVP